MRLITTSIIILACLSGIPAFSQTSNDTKKEAKAEKKAEKVHDVPAYCSGLYSGTWGLLAVGGLVSGKTGNVDHSLPE